MTKTNEEQDYAVERLREAGPYAIPFLVQALEQPGLSTEHQALIARNMGRLDRSVVPPLIATLDSPDAVVAADAAAVLGIIGDPRAIPHLTYLAVRGKTPSPAGNDEPIDPVREEARRAIERLTGRPFRRSAAGADPGADRRGAALSPPCGRVSRSPLDPLDLGRRARRSRSRTG